MHTDRSRPLARPPPTGQAATLAGPARRHLRAQVKGGPATRAVSPNGGLGLALDPAPVAPDQYGPLTSREWTKDGVIAVTELHIGVAWGCGNARRATYGDRSCAGGRLMSGWTSPLSRQ